MPLILAIILCFSLFLRSFGLTSSPPELFGDEIDVGYQAASLLTTGRDIRGQALPTYIHSIAEWRAPLLIYATVPSIWLFGNTVWGVRLPEVLFGSLAPILLFFLVYRFSGRKNLSIMASLLLAITPWHIHYSRAAFEVVLLVDLLLLGCILMMRKKFIFSALPFALCMYTYSTAIVFVPLLLLLNLRNLKALLVFATLCLPLGYHVLFGAAGERFGVVGISHQPEIVSNISTYRDQDQSVLGKILHNKYESVATHVLYNYLQSFSTEFLFIRGDTVLRHNSPVMGEFLPLTFPLFLIGVFVLVKHRQWFWLGWLLISPLPAALTYDGGTHATRLFLMVVPITVGISYGLQVLTQKIRLLILPILLIQLIIWFHFYLVHYPLISWQWWHYGYQQAFSALNRLSPNYSQVFINNTYEPSLERFSFWNNVAPREFQANLKSDIRMPLIAPNYDGFSFGSKYFFGTFADNSPVNINERLVPDSLYLISHRDEGYPYNTRILETVSDPIGQPLFYLVTKND